MSYTLKLDVFEGPLDVLLFLIRRDEIDIYNIPIAHVTDQYTQFLDVIREHDLDLAGEFLVMAATLIQIKAKMLLPLEADGDECFEDDDPRLELVEKLIEYKKFREAAGNLGSFEEREKLVFTRPFSTNGNGHGKGALETQQEAFVELNLYDLLAAFKDVVEYATEEPFQEIFADQITIDQKMDEIEARLRQESTLTLDEFVSPTMCRIEIICIFLALLELVRLRKVFARQSRLFGTMHLYWAE